MNVSRRSIMPSYTRRRLLLMKIIATNIDNCCTVVNSRSSKTWALPTSSTATFLPDLTDVCRGFRLGRVEGRDGVWKTTIRREGYGAPREPEPWGCGPTSVSVTGTASEVVAFRHRNDVAGAYRRRRCGNREPVEFTPFAGGGRRFHRHRCPRAVYAKRRAHRARESRDWRHCCWRANAPVRRAGVITNTCAAVIKPLGPSGFVVVFLLPSRPSATSTAQHRMFVRSHVPLDHRRRTRRRRLHTHIRAPNKGDARRRRRRRAPNIPSGLSSSHGWARATRVVVGVRRYCRCCYCYYYYYYYYISHKTTPATCVSPTITKRAFFPGRTANDDITRSSRK